MKPIRTVSCNADLVPMKHQERQGKVSPHAALSVYRAHNQVYTWWKPSWGERFLILFGWKVRHVFVGWTVSPMIITVAGRKESKVRKS